jgi:hypothetical protein
VGLSASTLSQILRKLDLPPEVIDIYTLRSSRDLMWYDRKELWDLVQEAQKGKKEDDLARIWTRENLVATICRYLNSGIPSILSDEAEEHTTVVCGYLRKEDFNPDAGTENQARGLHSDVTALLVNDDQKGPYQIQSIDSLLDSFFRDDGDPLLNITVPLPRALWMSGGVAEELGGRLLASFAAERLKRLESWAGRLNIREDDLFRHREAMRLMAEWTNGGVGGNLTIRTYAASCSSFKVGFSDRISDANASRALGYTRLPKYVWVVEAIDRQLRMEEKPPVRGTVVLDASTVSDAGWPTSAGALFAHLPGQAMLRLPGREPKDAPFCNEWWLPTGTDPYLSGRWNHNSSWLQSPMSTAARHKTATASL